MLRAETRFTNFNGPKTACDCWLSCDSGKKMLWLHDFL